MMKLFLFLSLLLLAAVVVVQAEPDFDEDFVDFPGQRFNPWSILSTTTIQHALAVGYDESSWNNIGSNDLEELGYNELSQDQLEHVQAIGFTFDQQWDCYMSHYNSYTWDSLVQLDIHRHLETLGWTEESWTAVSDGTEDVPDELSILESTPWSQLSEEQQNALEKVCWFPELWDDVALPEMYGIPRTYPEIRYTPFMNLTSGQYFLVRQVGWTEETWNNPATDSLEGQGFMARSTPERYGLTRLGFYQAQYDCYINHYQSYTWQDLMDWSLDEDAEMGGYTQESWGNWSSTLDDLDWNELSEEQQNALYQFCWFEEIWNMQPLGTWNNDNNDQEEEPETEPPQDEEEPETDPPADEEPETDPPAEEEPETDPPVEEEPVTDPPEEEEPETDPPAEEQPETDAPETAEPETDPPAEEPETEPPLPNDESENEEEEQGGDDQEEEDRINGDDEEEHVVETEESSSNTNQEQQTSSSKAMSGGAVAGITVVVLAVVAALMYITHRRGFSKGVEYSYAMDAVSSTLGDSTDTADDNVEAAIPTRIKGFMI